MGNHWVENLSAIQMAAVPVRCEFEVAPMSDSFDDFQERLKLGDPDMSEVYRRYLDPARRLAAKLLSGSLLQKGGATDVAQEGIITFWQKVDAGKVSADSWEAVWALLARIVANKCRRHAADFGAGKKGVKKRDRHREVPLSPDSSDSAAELQLPASTEPPDVCAMRQEVLVWLAGRLPENYMEIAELSLEGYGPREIAKRMKCAERTVHRARRVIREQLEMLDQSD